MKPRPTLIAYLDTYAFSSLTESFSLSNLVERILSLRNKITEIARAHNISLRIFSDFAFLSYDLSPLVKLSRGHVETNNIPEIRDAIRSFVDTLKMCYSEYLKVNLLVRGGISFGETITHEHTFVGKAIIEAVRLEQQGLAPLILFPAKILDDLGGAGWKGIMDVPIKDDRIIRAAVIIPSDTVRFETLLKERRDHECYEMSRFSGILDRAYLTVSRVVANYNKISFGG